VKPERSYLLFALFLLALAASAQTSKKITMEVSFPDSIQIVLENTRNTEAMVVGSGLPLAWNNLALTQQQRIQQQFYAMKRKGYKLRPHFVQYFGSLVNAVNVERADPLQINSFLNVMDQVIEQYRADKALKFLANTKTFFKRHALYYDNTYRLYARDDRYTFDFIAFVPPPVDTTTVDDWNDDNWNNNNWDDNSNDIPPAEVKPFWETQDPPPLLEGPVIRFEQVSLNFVTAYDSVMLESTSGIYSLLDNRFVGKAGRFDWSAAGLNGSEVYSTFEEYWFDTRKPQLKSNLVRLNYEGKTPVPVPGIFEFRSVSRKAGQPSSYPRFTSYENNINVRDLAPSNLRYTGGFSLQGPAIRSTNVSGDQATIVVSDSTGAKKFLARSKEFVFTPEKEVTAAQSEITIYQRNDSIRHPSVQLRYDFNRQRLVLTSENGSLRNTPYSSSYFNVDFSAALIRWNINADSLEIYSQMTGSTVPMIVESTDYYHPDDLQQLRGIGFKFHPLMLIANYCVQNNTREVYGGALAQAYGLDIREVQQAIKFLEIKGLVEYLERQDLALVKEKAITQFLASKGEADYDNLKIASQPGSYALANLSQPRLPNATVNFTDGHMVVRGVEKFSVSDSLNVMVEPDSSVITLLQNRDIKFNGMITAGNFEIHGKNFTLKYDSFFINLLNIDSINFFSIETNAKGETIRRKINNAMVGADSVAAAEGGLGNISQSSGTLFISRPNNKSGKISIPNYPRLDATTGGVIYFNRPEILNNAYDRSIFFVVPPFKLDSLNDADPTAIYFNGTFFSSGMFPKFKERLHTMADKSLGFEHTIPGEGYQLYNGQGKLFGNIRLDNQGIRSDGIINFWAATIKSQDFVFYADSVVGTGLQASMEEKQFGSVYFPEAYFPNYAMKWEPKRDNMRLRTTTKPFTFYNSTAELTGQVIVSKNGLVGSGKLDTRGADIRSREFTFASKEFNSRHARLRVKSAEPDKPLIDGTDVSVRFNLAQNFADISPEVTGEAAINFPFAQFKTSISNARWDLNAQRITMTKDANTPLEDSYFYTTRKDLDSLSFYAEKAEYDLGKQELKVSGIPYIIVADAKITPENGEVLILENARIGTLRNTTIVIDTLNGYHLLTDGVVDIKSRKEFTGYATYQYINFLKDTFAIKMTDFRLEPIVETETSKRTGRRHSPSALQTVSTGSVAEADRLVLGAGMYYKGDMIMYASKPALRLKGAIKLDIKRIKYYNTWIQYEQSGDETEVMINYDHAMSEEGVKLTAGLHFAAADNGLYASFMAERMNDDEDLFNASGKLFYDVETKEYKIEDPEKAAGNKLTGKVLSYNDETGAIKFEGPVQFFKPGKDFSINAGAIGQTDIDASEVKMNALVMMNAPSVATIFDIMATDLVKVIKNEGAEEGLGEPTDLLYKMADLVGEAIAQNYDKQSAQGYVSLGTIPALAKPLTFADVNLKWSPKHKAFYSEGPLGLSNINRTDINAAFEGFMEVKKNEDGGPVFNVFFKASPESWYYVSYEDQRLLMFSNNSEFNQAVAKRTNSGKAKIGELIYIPATEDETLEFVNRFRQQYLGIQVPYSLYGESRAKRRQEKKEDDDGF
jgi:hypothetical protein